VGTRPSPSGYQQICQPIGRARCGGEHIITRRAEVLASPRGPDRNERVCGRLRAPSCRDESAPRQCHHGRDGPLPYR